MTTPHPQYMTVQQAAEQLGFNAGQILNAIRLKKLQAVKTEFAILPEELEAFRSEYVRVKRNGETYVRQKQRPKSKAQLRIEAIRQARAEEKAQRRAAKVGQK